jgi:hypothetical protein
MPDPNTTHPQPYPNKQEHQKGYVLSRYDKPLKIYRRTLKEFQEATKVRDTCVCMLICMMMAAWGSFTLTTGRHTPKTNTKQAREAVAERRTLEMELLRLIETTERGRKATRGQHAAILQIVGALERGFQVRCPLCSCLCCEVKSKTTHTTNHTYPTQTTEAVPRPRFLQRGQRHRRLLLLLFFFLLGAQRRRCLRFRGGRERVVAPGVCQPRQYGQSGAHDHGRFADNGGMYK